MDSIFERIDAWLIALLFAGTMFGCWALGWRRGCRTLLEEGEDPGNKFIDGSLALLGLLLAFTFAMALGRHDQRRLAVVAESNAIGDFYTCATLLKETQKSQLQEVIREYARHILVTPQDTLQGEEEKRARQRGQELVGRMTALVADALAAGTPIAVSLTNTLNNVTSTNTSRLAAYQESLPWSIVLLLFLSAMVPSFLIGEKQGSSHKKHLAGSMSFIVLVALVIFVTLDLNQPRRGLIPGQPGLVGKSNPVHESMSFTMKKIGLALSGGGFRASLYHLGLIRFLRDAGILPQVTHITAVSGGSIVAAHLVLNWDRYNGLPNEFDAAAAELLSFVRLDVRNRITRRFPLTLPLRWSRRLLGLSNRKLTLTGQLEYHYERYLYGDTSLFELPEKPQLHLLATNLSEGCLCSFNRNGLLMVRRQPGNSFRLERIHMGLATVAMAVAASSAFPGFFPPLELTAAVVGATGDFGRQAYTDGGVFDNLGVRMFRCLERPLLVDSPLSQNDFVDFPAVVEALQEASKSHKETPLRRLTQLLLANCNRPDLLLLTNEGNSEGAGVLPEAGPVQVGKLPPPRGLRMATVPISWCPGWRMSCAITSFTTNRSSPT